MALAAVDAAVRGAVEHDLLRVEVLATALYKAMAELQRADADDAPRQALQVEVARLEAEINRLVAAIAAGGHLESSSGCSKSASGDGRKSERP